MPFCPAGVDAHQRRGLHRQRPPVDVRRRVRVRSRCRTGSPWTRMRPRRRSRRSRARRRCRCPRRPSPSARLASTVVAGGHVPHVDVGEAGCVSAASTASSGSLVNAMRLPSSAIDGCVPSDRRRRSPRCGGSRGPWRPRSRSAAGRRATGPWSRSDRGSSDSDSNATNSPVIARCDGLDEARSPTAPSPAGAAHQMGRGRRQAADVHVRGGGVRVGRVQRPVAGEGHPRAVVADRRLVAVGVRRLAVCPGGAACEDDRSAHPIPHVDVGHAIVVAVVQPVRLATGRRRSGPFWLTAELFVSLLATGAGSGADSSELPDRMAVVPAGSVAADAEAAWNRARQAMTPTVDRITSLMHGI